ncbi:hypothetical protein ACAW63_21160 [Pseudomonas sp. QE6]|uniref:hypothetical protein n=1 Tax=Pseudomonas sp. QE6 TaxID=3242491 RepID=UPI0035278ACD
MDLCTVRRSIVEPALLLLPAKMESLQAVVMLLAIGLQESRFEYRRQMGSGPAKSFWRAEQSGGMVTGLLRFRVESIRDLATGRCAVHGVVPAAPEVWNAIEHDDILAAGLAAPAAVHRSVPPSRAGQRVRRLGAVSPDLDSGACSHGEAAQRTELRKM